MWAAKHLVVLFSLSTCLLCSPAQAADDAKKPFLTVQDLIADGYQKLAGYQISELMKKHVIEVVDIETDALVVSQTKDGEHALSRKFDDVQADNAKSLLDTRLLARAPALDGEIERKVAADALVVTNGLRTYRYTVYKKNDKIYAARDIDYGNVYFEVSVR